MYLCHKCKKVQKAYCNNSHLGRNALERFHTLVDDESSFLVLSWRSHILCRILFFVEPVWDWRLLFLDFLEFLTCSCIVQTDISTHHNFYFLSRPQCEAFKPLQLIYVELWSWFWNLSRKFWVAPRESGTKEFSRPTFEYNFISLIPISKPFICSFSKISIYNFFLKLYLPTIHFWHILIERNRKEEQSFIWTNFLGWIAGKMLHITPTYVGRT